MQGSEQALDWVMANLLRDGMNCVCRHCTRCECEVGTQSAVAVGDAVHFFHVVPNPQAQLLTGGVGLADAGEFMVAPPDPKDDKKQVQLL